MITIFEKIRNLKEDDRLWVRRKKLTHRCASPFPSCGLGGLWCACGWPGFQHDVEILRGYMPSTARRARILWGVVESRSFRKTEKAVGRQRVAGEINVSCAAYDAVC